METEKGKHKSKNHRTVGTTTFKTKVLIINADTEKRFFFLFLANTVHNRILNYICPTYNFSNRERNGFHTE